MANFNSYIPKLRNAEGGFQDNPEDAGNYNSLKVLVGTNYGISARFYETVIGRPPSRQDMLSISQANATELFRVYFWNKARANEIKSQAVADTVVDHFVNAGNGIRLAQQVLNDNFGKNLATDNGMGPKTLAAINSVNPVDFVTLYNRERENYYRRLSNSPTFLNGWLTRLQDFAAHNSGKIISSQLILLSAVIIYGVYSLNQPTNLKTA
ncbi:glycoside hydrolase family 108 protein [Cochleicola gelatinilyticus]|uniref:Uncharacterized protein n=1 Tax=Cochleicola gelatinilyticus TaxID=1763537 RepID=A0A167IKQ5_9FLAO|nr:glycosyl hydrolase 108 family protein [Cochleicola gelatinilyticus]OAB79749.1 hypothetical protein ULVI_03110 [Cochleicola gelatinilyticus]